MRIWVYVYRRAFAWVWQPCAAIRIGKRCLVDFVCFYWLCCAQQEIVVSTCHAAAWRRLCAGLSLRRSEFDPIVVHCEIYGWEIDIWTAFSPGTSISPVSIIPRLLHTCCSYQKDERANTGNLPKSNTVFGNRGALARKYFHLVFYVIFCTRLTCHLSPVGLGPLKFSAAPFIRSWPIRWPMSRSLSSVLNMASLFIWFRLGACKLRGLRRGNRSGEVCRGTWRVCLYFLFVPKCTSGEEDLRIVSGSK